MTRRTALFLAAGSCLLAAAPAAAQDEAPAGEAQTVRLSNERSETRVATAELIVKVRSRPDPGAPQGPGLRATTEHGAPEIYLALMEVTGTDGRRWVKIRIPRRPNGQTGWVRREALGRYRLLTTSLIVDRKASRSHGRVERRNNSYFYIDSSTNGSYVSVGGQNEVMVRRREIELKGSGRISFGGSASDPKADFAEFEHL